jgi:opacity protein-like surface antigen
MKKHLLLLTIASLSTSPVSASKYSWTGAYMKLLPAFSDLKLNYSGDKPYTLKLSLSETKVGHYNPRYHYPTSTSTTVEKVSAGAITLDLIGGVSLEVSENFGLLAEIGGMFGGSSNFIKSDNASIFQLYTAAGIFYHQPSFRIYGMGGIGIGRDIFGYPNGIETLQEGGEVSSYDNEKLINSTLGLTYRGSIGFDYKITTPFIVGVSYTYTRSKTTTTLKNEETFYISNHTLAAMIGAQL